MSHRFFFLVCILLIFSLAAPCIAMSSNKEKSSSAVSKRAFGVDSDGEAIDEYTLTNAQGMTARVLTYGATLRELLVPTANGKSKSVVLGFDKLAQYESMKNRHYFGATIGRYANRIAGAKFSLDGKEYKLAANNAPNMLHGGTKGFDRRCWKATIVSDSKDPAVRFTYESPDMEEGFPGNVQASVTYTLTDDALRLDYIASSDKSTPINLTNHAYFNLDGAGNGTILKQRLKIDADEYLPVDKVLIPLGKPATVQDTPFDFRQAKEIGADLAKVPGGYDHNWNLRYKDGKLFEALTAYAAESGLSLKMLTTEPGVQIYIGQGQDGTLKGPGGTLEKYCGFTLEAQRFPDSPHHPEYPDAILRPGKEYKQTTIYQFRSIK